MPSFSKPGSAHKTNFEPRLTEIGEVSADYFVYIGPYDHNIEALSESAFFFYDGKKYVFKKKEKVVVGGSVQYFWGVLKLVWEDNDD